jgi:hypothetical protein
MLCSLERSKENHLYAEGLDSIMLSMAGWLSFIVSYRKICWLDKRFEFG